MRRRERTGAGLLLLWAGAAALAVEPMQRGESVWVAVVETSTPVVSYAIASPRAFPRSAPIDGADGACATGVAARFTPPDGTLEIPVGTRGVVSPSRGIERIQGTDTDGTIETMRTVPWCEAVTQTGCPDYVAVGLVDGAALLGEAKTGMGDSEEVVPCPWIIIATDGARDSRTVRTSFSRPVEPSKEPSSRQEASAEPLASPAQDTDVVFIQVRALDRLDPGGKPSARTADAPDLIDPSPMPNEVRSKAIGPDESDAKDPGPESVVAAGVLLKSQPSPNVVPS